MASRAIRCSEAGRAGVPYDPAVVETRRQEAWRTRAAFRAPEPAPARMDVFLHAVAPFPSGRIHLGHVRAYTIGDAYARYRRARGDGVLFSIGFDAFGLPAELAAISAGMPTRAWVERSCAQMTAQMRRLGLSFDWDRVWVTSEEDMYRWSQWLFVAFLRHGLVYREIGTADWCDACNTTLAVLQVENGRCWRCGEAVRLVRRPQWRLRIGAYARENDDRLEALDGWERHAKSNQRSVLGRVEGVEVEARALDGRTVWVFTPHRDALADARFVLLSPRHPEIEQWASDDVREQLQQIRLEGRARSGRHAERVAVIDAGVTVSVQGLRDALPVAISPVADSRFGVTAVFGIPQQDRTDAIIAKRLGLTSEIARAPTAEAVPGVRPAIRYRVGDLSISRQRSWGTPIPIIHCAACGEVPVPLEDLPVRLPRDLVSSADGNALAECEAFVGTRCPACGGPARRETDTLDCHFDALWFWAPRLVPRTDRGKRMFDHPEIARWLPGRIVFGADGGGFLFNQRFTCKALRDIGPLAYLPDGEPFMGATVHEMVVRDGRKMSKHLGNVVDPDDVVEGSGADALRLAVLYEARPQKPLCWSDSTVRMCADFLREVWELAHEHFAATSLSSEPTRIDRSDPPRRDLARVCEATMRQVGEDIDSLRMHQAVRRVMRLFHRIRRFEDQRRARSEALDALDAQAQVVALRVLVLLLVPFAPHVGEELWIASGRGHEDAAPPWPERC